MPKRQPSSLSSFLDFPLSNYVWEKREVRGLGEGGREVRGWGNLWGILHSFTSKHSLFSLSLTLSLSLSLSLSFLSFLSRFPANCWRTLTLSLSLKILCQQITCRPKLFVPLLLPVKSPAECCQCILNVIITPVEKEWMILKRSSDDLRCQCKLICWEIIL